MPKELTEINFFAGIGGATEGLRRAGFTCRDFVEYNPNAATIHRDNQTGRSHTIDILDLDPRELPFAPDNAWFSPPCQTHSLANAHRGETENDFALARKIVEIIDTIKPRSIAIENVPTYLTSQSFRIIREYLDRNGWVVSCKILQATDYGNPSLRKRFICRALAKGRGIAPIEGFKSSRRSCKDAFNVLTDADLVPAIPLEIQQSVIDNLPKNHDYIIERRGYYNKPKSVLAASHMWCIKSSTHHDMKPPRNSLSRIGSYCVAYNAIIDNAFYQVTPKMLGLLMGFPINYKWGDLPAEAAAGIGNAVPVGLAEAIGKSLIASL